MTNSKFTCASIEIRYVNYHVHENDELRVTAHTKDKAFITVSYDEQAKGITMFISPERAAALIEALQVALKDIEAKR